MICLNESDLTQIKMFMLPCALNRTLEDLYNVIESGLRRLPFDLYDLQSISKRMCVACYVSRRPAAKETGKAERNEKLL